ncbi:hypothetical protein QZN01_29605 [Burkholderia cenocepacia]|uniref:hypothetical protein n=1 Tax=Burkholderia TaxID=32008 RepID=UPI00118756D4|nr:MULTISPECIES: hypothetical protein [Burkholderia]MCW5115595.1 hypothetical protein [Burkholderia cenocepacia]MCW5129049.1 hypothetical protein [Burkholderia cenocepacia]MCW5172027.1 hypothetical protein [Burkholderia cenocepacia]MDN7826835.1 hypothetical protein [Burkholderia cenocepacia]HEM8999251.1 hypothetical protein [Burkholderia cenocepacia]
MTSTLQDWLDKHEPTTPLLYWCHTTNVSGFREMLRGDALNPQMCNVFKSDLSYFFYGRPAYRFKGDPSLLDAHAWPVVLVFKNTIENFSCSAFPFDSGAFRSGRYQKWLDSAWEIDSFKIDVASTTHARHVAAFYEGNGDYLDGNGKRFHSTSFGLNLEAKAVSEMIRECRDGGADDRRFTVEMIVDAPIPLDPQYVAMVIIPSALADSVEVAPLASRGIRVYPYRVITHLTASHHHALLENVVFDRQNEEGKL